MIWAVDDVGKMNEDKFMEDLDLYFKVFGFYSGEESSGLHEESVEVSGVEIYLWCPRMWQAEI